MAEDRDKRTRRVRQVRSKTKCCAQSPTKAVVCIMSFAPEGQTVNTGYYLQVLRRLRDVIRRKRPETWSSGYWQIHRDRAPVLSSQVVQHFLAKHEIPHVQQTPYATDFAPCDFVSQNSSRSEREKLRRCGNHKTKCDTSVFSLSKLTCTGVFSDGIMCRATSKGITPPLVG